MFNPRLSTSAPTALVGDIVKTPVVSCGSDNITVNIDDRSSRASPLVMFRHALLQAAA